MRTCMILLILLIMGLAVTALFSIPIHHGTEVGSQVTVAKDQLAADNDNKTEDSVVVEGVTESYQEAEVKDYYPAEVPLPPKEAFPDTPLGKVLTWAGWIVGLASIGSNAFDKKKKVTNIIEFAGNILHFIALNFNRPKTDNSRRY